MFSLGLGVTSVCGVSELCGEEVTAFSPRATRTLYAGNLPFNISHSDLADMFSEKGHILVGLLTVLNGCYSVICSKKAPTVC